MLNTNSILGRLACFISKERKNCKRFQFFFFVVTTYLFLVNFLVSFNNPQITKSRCENLLHIPFYGLWLSQMGTRPALTKLGVVTEINIFLSCYVTTLRFKNILFPYLFGLSEGEKKSIVAQPALLGLKNNTKAGATSYLEGVLLCSQLVTVCGFSLKNRNSNNFINSFQPLMLKVLRTKEMKSFKQFRFCHTFVVGARLRKRAGIIVIGSPFLIQQGGLKFIRGGAFIWSSPLALLSWPSNKITKLFFKGNQRRQQYFA
jgi:hypothetical protein